MGLLKEDLKNAKGLLKDGKSQDVIYLLEEHINSDVEDYFLFIFAGLAYSNCQKNEDGYKMYRKAIKLDESKGDAWKGIYKLIEPQNHENVDLFDLEVCEKMKQLIPEKMTDIQHTCHRILFKLRDWSKLVEEEFSNDFAVKIIKLLSPKISKLEEIEKKIIDKSFNLIFTQIEEDLELFVPFCKFIQGESRIPNLVKLYKQLPEPWILSELAINCYEQYFDCGTFPDFAKILDNPIISLLEKRDIAKALEILDNLPISSKVVYPESLLYVGLLAESENWNQCEQTVRSIMNITKNENVKNTCYGWISRIILETDQDIKKLSNVPLKLPQFFIEDIKTRLIQELPLNETIKTEKDEILANLLTSLHNNNVTKEKDGENVEKLLKQSEIDWKDLLLSAEIRHLLNIDATSLLVKAAKLNPRSSRVFFVLGKSLISKNPAKSRTCLERAVKIQPANEQYVKQLDEVLISQNATSNERLQHLKKLVQMRENRRKSNWLAENIAILYLETNNLDAAIEELQHMVRLEGDNKLAWARLANAYFKKGHLRASVSSYEHLSQLKNGHRYTIPMIRVMIQLREFETSLEKLIEYRQTFGNLEEDESSKIALDILEAQIRLNLMSNTNGEDRRTHLRESLKVLNRCLEIPNLNFSMVYKLLGDALLKISEYHPRFYEFFEMNSNWKIENEVSCVKLSIKFYSIVVRMRKDDCLAWYDLSISLMRQFKHEKNNKNMDILTKSRNFIKHAIKMTKDESLLSTLWTVLAENLRLAEKCSNRQLHCLTRALQLNKINDSAWLELAVLCLTNGDMMNANKCLEQAIKYNPHNADAWCTWAQHAHLQGSSHDATIMFRQALCIKPTPSSVIGYTSYICKQLQKQNNRFDCAGTALVFEPVVDLREMANCHQICQYYLALISDFFGYYRESLQCFELAKTNGDIVERVKMKLGVLDPTFVVKLESIGYSNVRLETLSHYSASQLLSFLKQEMPVYAQLFEFIGESKLEEFRQMYAANVKNISVPLFVSANIALRIQLPNDCIGTLHDALPRHELIDYYPTILPDGMDNGLRHLEQDGEIPFRYRHRVAKELLDELKILRENHEANLIISS